MLYMYIYMYSNLNANIDNSQMINLINVENIQYSILIFKLIHIIDLCQLDIYIYITHLICQ